MGTTRSVKGRWRAMGLACAMALATSACELLVDFDRSLIPQEGGAEDATLEGSPDGGEESDATVDGGSDAAFSDTMSRVDGSAGDGASDATLDSTSSDGSPEATMDSTFSDSPSGDVTVETGSDAAPDAVVESEPDAADDVESGNDGGDDSGD